MSNLVRSGAGDSAGDLSGGGASEPSPLTKSKMKAFLSSRNLDELQISIRSRSKSRASVKSASNLSRLLDRVTDDEDDELAAYDGDQAMDDDVCIFPGKKKSNRSFVCFYD